MRLRLLPALRSLAAALFMLALLPACVLAQLPSGCGGSESQPSVMQGQERVLCFSSIISILPDGLLEVQETMLIYAGQKQIRHGIFRDFALSADDDVDFVEIKHNGQASPYRLEEVPGFLRLYIGQEGAMLPKGAHRYDIRYTAGNQIRFLENFDALYWNVTGNNWAFVIEEARVVVELPEKGLLKGVEFFTGPKGSKQANGAVGLGQYQESAFIKTDQPLRPGEGLTIQLRFDKGAVKGPYPQKIK